MSKIDNECRKLLDKYTRRTEFRTHRIHNIYSYIENKNKIKYIIYSLIVFVLFTY